MDTTIQLGNRQFRYGNNPQDKERRNQFFLHNRGELTVKEYEIMDALGITEEVEESMRQYLPEFFEKLPNCSDDTRLSLSKECEVPHYVLWSAMFHRYDTKRKQFETLPNRPISQLDHAMANSLVNRLTTNPPDHVRRLFTLLLSNTQTRPVPPTHPAHRLFTLRLTTAQGAVVPAP